jgi:hypothetical protein
MSEHSSLVMQVHLSQEQWTRYLASEIGPVQRFGDWGELIDPARLNEVQYGDFRTVKDWLEQFGANDQVINAPSCLDVDWAHGCINCVVFFYSEDPVEFVRDLNVLRSVAHHKDSSDADFIVIYPHFWRADDVDAAVTLAAGESRLLNKETDHALIRSLAWRAETILEAHKTPLREMAERDDA